MRAIRTASLSVLAALLSCAGTRAAPVASLAPRSGEPAIRVLLAEAVGEVVVSDAGTGRVLAKVGLAATGGVRVDGGPPQNHWRLAAHQPVRVADLTVRGAVEVVAREGGAGLAVINEVPLEHYLAGTLGREMYASWAADALRAQAVASRTYALHQRRSRGDALWHVSADTQSQVYGGAPAESAAVRAALAETRGEVLTWRGEPILAAFHSSSGGRTASAEEVWGAPLTYLVSAEIADEWDSPDSYWRVPVSRTTLGRAVATVGEDIGPIVEARISERTESGRVARIELVGESGRGSLSGRRLRSALGEAILKSTLFELREDAEGFVFVGAGNGHGVGMSQWAARAMARRGSSYRAILRAFYPGTEVTRVFGTAGAAQ